MIVKDNFTLLKNTPNVLKLSSSVIKSNSIENGARKVFVILKLLEQRINHFTKDKVFKLISDKNERKRLHVVTLPNYPLHVSYNKPTKGIVINLSAFGTDDISRIDPKNLYACMVYGICFQELASGNVNIKESHYSAITNFLLSIFVRLFGKEFGLLGAYSSEINKLKFLISCYVLVSFFGVNKAEAYSRSGTIASFQYRDIINDLNKFDFSNIEDFIKAMSQLGATPGMDRYRFTAKVLRHLSVNFLPAIEDVSRFISVITTSNFSGSNVIPTFIFRYNNVEFAKILSISKVIFR